MPGPVVLQTDISNKGHLFKGSVSPRENTLFCRTVSISLKHAAERERERKGAKIGYVIHQNITVDTWRHWFPRHACTVLHLLDARWRTQCPQLATLQPKSRFSAAGSSGQSEAANATRWAGLLSADRDVYAPLAKATPRLPNMVGCL